MLNRRTLIIGGAAAAVIVIAIGAYVVWDNYGRPQMVSTREPIDVVQDFYTPWLDAALSTTTTPYREGLAQAPILSREVRNYIKDAQAKGLIDPVLCQTTLPADIALRMVSSTTAQAEVLVTARKSTSTEQAIVTLRALSGGWYINAIKCSPGEFGPQREFSFDQEGYLLKSVPATLDPKYWYIVFEQDGEKGHYAPLLLNASSTCRDFAGTTAPCNAANFMEATKVHVQGQMTELGVQVTRIELVKE